MTELLVDDCRASSVWRLNLGREFPGASGKAAGATAPDGVQCLGVDLDFRAGGRYGGVERAVRIPMARAVGFAIWSVGFRHGMIRLRDSTGQEHAAGFSMVPGRWTRVRLLLTPQVFRGHWHGADDGVFHWPVRTILISAQPDGARRGRFFLKNVVLGLAPGAAAGRSWRSTVRAPAPGNIVFVRDCPVRLELEVQNRLNQARIAAVHWKITRADGVSVAVGERRFRFGPWARLEWPVLLKASRPGWYGVRLRIRDALGGESEEDAGAVGIVVRPAGFGREDARSFFGIHTSDSAAAARIGVKWTRIQRAWWWGESIRGRYYWPDAGIEAARRAHLKIMLTLHYQPPGWAAAEVGKGRLWPPPEKLLEGWARYVRACVLRYRDKVACFEIQNEPDLTCWRHPNLSFKVGVASYAAVFLRAAAVIRRLAPEVPIAGVDVSDGDYHSGLRFSRAVLKRIAPLPDVYTGHPYASPRYFGPGRRPIWPYQNQLISKLRSSQALMREFGRPDHVWIGEKGWGLDVHEPPDGKYSLAYARCVARALATGRSVPGVDRWFWFLQDGCNEHGYEYGLWRSNGGPAQPLPAAVAYAVAARFLDSVLPERRGLALPKGLRGWVFRGSAPVRAVAVVFGLTEEFRVEAEWPAGITAADIWGAPCGLDRLRIGPAPVYFSLAGNGAPAALRQCFERARFIPARPFRVRLVRFAAVNRLAATIENLGSAPVAGRIEAAGKQRRFELPGGVARTVFLSVPGEAAKPGRTVGVRIWSGPRLMWEGTVVARFRVCPRQEDIRLDGRLDEWRGPGMHLAGRKFILPPDPGVGWAGPNDLSVTAWWAWDANNFYLALAVRDDEHAAPCTAPADFWKSDSVQAAFDPDNDAGPESGFDGEDREYGWVSAAGGVRVFQTWPAPGRRVQFPAAVRRHGNETVYELAVPWKALGIKPVRGRLFSFNFIVNDNDGKGRAYWMGPRPGIGEAKRPGAFLDLLLAGPARR